MFADLKYQDTKITPDLLTCFCLPGKRRRRRYSESEEYDTDSDTDRRVPVNSLILLVASEQFPSHVLRQKSLQE